MTFVENTKIDPVQSILSSEGTVLRSVALGASIVGMILPGATSSAMGMAQSASVLQLVTWVFAAPVLIGAAIAMPGIAAHYSRLTDIVVAVVSFIVAAYAGYVVFDAMGQVSSAGSMGGMTGQYVQALGVSVSPGVGLFVTAAAAGLMVLQAVRALK